MFTSRYLPVGHLMSNGSKALPVGHLMSNGSKALPVGIPTYPKLIVSHKQGEGRNLGIY